MLFHVILALMILCASLVLVWAIRTWALLPIRSGPCESIEITVCAHGEAPELEMQLRGLLWLQSNGIVPCSIRVLDSGLAPEASARLQFLVKDKGNIISEQRGTERNGRNESDAGTERQHCVDHLSE